jgi:hypothetical protein
LVPPEHFSGDEVIPDFPLPAPLLLLPEVQHSVQPLTYLIGALGGYSMNRLVWGFTLRFLLKVAGPLRSIQAQEKPECEPPMITIFFSFYSLILAMMDLKWSLRKKWSARMYFSLGIDGKSLS